MTTLTKSFIVVYNNSNEIIAKSVTNNETCVGDGMSSAEFDTEEELNSFISENSLVETDIV